MYPLYILVTSLVIKISSGFQNANLPYCPQSVQFLPQNLPMHCIMPSKPTGPMPFPNFPPYPQFAQFPPPFQPIPPQQQPNPPVKPPSIPTVSPVPAAPFPGGPMLLPGPPMGLPGPMPMPMPMPPPLPPMPYPGAPPKLPVIVMPFYSPTSSSNNKHKEQSNKVLFINKRRRRPRPHWSDSSDSGDTDSTSETDTTDDSGELWRDRRPGRRSMDHDIPETRHRSKKRHRNKEKVVVPVLSYVTKDGYIVYQKKISDDEAQNWLNTNKGHHQLRNVKNQRQDSEEVLPDYDAQTDNYDEVLDGSKTVDASQDSTAESQKEHAAIMKRKLEKILKRKTKSNLRHQKKGKDSNRQRS